VKYLDEYRDAALARQLATTIHNSVTRPWSIMEICGGQTHAIVRFGIDELLPSEITFIHGPGCPVCVTPVELIDRAIAIARTPGVILCSFGDMIRVPGSGADLQAAKAEGADVRVVYSPLDAVALARSYPEHKVVFFAVGFETTAPANAMAVHQAHSEGLANFSVLVSHVLVPPALELILGAPNRRVDGVLAAGHVCTIVGTEPYRPLAERYRVPIVVTGFEPLDLLQGVLLTVRQLESGRHEVENAYARAVRPRGNEPALALIDKVFRVVNRNWRGIGPIRESGLALRVEYSAHDAERIFGVDGVGGTEDPECRSGLVLQGFLKPRECPAFGTRCTPDTPLGATMVSSEGACAAYYRYRRWAA